MITSTTASTFTAVTSGVTLATSTAFSTTSGVISGRPLAGPSGGYVVTLKATNSKGASVGYTILVITPLRAGTIGSYTAMVKRDARQNGNLGDFGGRLDIVISGSAAYSGKLTLGSVAYSINGALNVSPVDDPTGLALIKTKDNQVLSLNFKLNLTSQTLTGYLRYGGLDGDGDRLIMVDSDGRLVEGDELLYIIAKDRHSRGVLNGGIVGTVMSNFGLEKAIMELGVPFIRTSVGDRYVLEALKDKGWKIGGESSGHIVCLDKTTTGDGIVAALQILAIMIKRNVALNELTSGISLLPQVLINHKTEHASALAKNESVLKSVNSLAKKLKNNGRVLLRPSGTEPILRVMVEGSDSLQGEQHAQQLVNEIKVIEQQLMSDNAGV